MTNEKIKMHLTLKMLSSYKFNFDPDPDFNPKMHFFHFFKSLIFLMRCHQISSVAVCVQLTEFSDNIFKMPIFKPIFNCFEI